jgi:hypothetical protein
MPELPTAALAVAAVVAAKALALLLDVAWSARNRR